jgi:negative regulator of genetic competence, sporulation and motility
VGQQYAVGPRTFSWDGTTWRVYASSEEDPALTQEEIQDFVAPLLNHASHSNITASYNDIDNKIILSGTATLTNEQVQDAIAPLFEHANHTNLSATYDDDNNKILLNSQGLTEAQAITAITPYIIGLS